MLLCLLLGTFYVLYIMCLHTCNYIILYLGDSCVNLSSKVRNLGAIFDSKLKLISHVNTVCPKAHNQLRNIGKIHKYLSQEIKEIIVHAFVTTRLDYLNSLLYEMLPITSLNDSKDY